MKNLFNSLVFSIKEFTVVQRFLFWLVIRIIWFKFRPNWKPWLQFFYTWCGIADMRECNVEKLFMEHVIFCYFVFSHSFVLAFYFRHFYVVLIELQQLAYFWFRISYFRCKRTQQIRKSHVVWNVVTNSSLCGKVKWETPT